MPPHSPQLVGSISPNLPVFVRKVEASDPANVDTLRLSDDTEIKVGYTIDQLPDLTVANTLQMYTYLGISGQDCNGVVIAICVHGYSVVKIKTGIRFTLGTIIYGKVEDTNPRRIALVDKSDADPSQHPRIGVVLPSAFPVEYISVMVAH